MSGGVEQYVSGPGFPRQRLAALSDDEARTTFLALTRLFRAYGVETPEAAHLIEARRLLELQLRLGGREALVDRLHEEALAP